MCLKFLFWLSAVLWLFCCDRHDSRVCAGLFQQDMRPGGILSLCDIVHLLRYVSCCVLTCFIVTSLEEERAGLICYSYICLFILHVLLSVCFPFLCTWRGSSFGSASAWHAKATPSSIPSSGTFFSGDLIMKKILRPCFLFR